MAISFKDRSHHNEHGRARQRRPSELAGRGEFSARDRDKERARYMVTAAD